MIIKKIAKLCNDSKTIRIYEDSRRNVQWISDGTGIYPLYGMPWLDSSSVFTVLDIPEEKRSKYGVFMSKLPDGINFGDTDIVEHMLPSNLISIGYAGEVLMPARTSQGLWFYYPKSLAPMGDQSSLELYERTTTNGGLYIAAKSGLILQAIIFPILPSPKALQKHLTTLSCELSETIDSLEGADYDENEDTYHSKLDGKGYPTVDPDTGEVMDSEHE